MPIDVRHHRRRNEAVAVLQQRMAQIAQLRVLAAALLSMTWHPNLKSPHASRWCALAAEHQQNQ